MSCDDEMLVTRLRLPGPASPVQLSDMRRPTVPTRRRAIDPFVIAKIEPLKAAAEALSGSGCGALMVWLCLAYETRRRDTSTVHLSNVMLAEWGVSRRVKYEALQQLERAGLVSVSRKGKTSPIVTVMRV